MVTLPVAPETVIPEPAMLESTPVLLNDVPSYESPVPAVVVATPVQPPLMNASTCPAAPVKMLFEVVAMVRGRLPPSTERPAVTESAEFAEETVSVATEPKVVRPEVLVKYARPETAMSVVVAIWYGSAADVLPPTQTPPIAKQPPERLIPTFEVEVAEPEMVRPESVVVPKPSAATVRNCVVGTDEAIWNAGAVCPDCVCTPRVPNGVEVPIPSLPMISRSAAKVDDAETMTPTVVVGASAPFTSCQSLMMLSDDDETLLLNEVQSAAERQPKVPPFAVAQLNEVPS